MMKMAMRLQRTQLPSLLKYTVPGFYSINLFHYVLAGYTQMNSMAIGAAGGSAGDVSESGRYQYGAGGGGGGSLMNYTWLPFNMGLFYIEVGAKGANGGAGLPGSNGGQSEIGGEFAYGGFGATPGSFAGTNELPSYGGAGGLNSAGYGQAGDAGHAGGMPALSGHTAGDGEFEDMGSGRGGGGGGGGGQGRYNPSTGPGGPLAGPPRAGAWGSMSGVQPPGGPWQAPGGAAATNRGGFGGGANLGIITGVTEYYGTNGNGAVALAFE